MHKKIKYWRCIFTHKYSQTEQGLVQVFEGWKPFLNFSLVFKKALLLIYFTCVCVLPVRQPCIVCMWCMQMLDKGMEALELSTAVVAGNEPPGSFGRATSAFTAESPPVPRGTDYHLLWLKESFLCQHLKISIVSEQYHFAITVPQCENDSWKQSLVFQMESTVVFCINSHKDRCLYFIHKHKIYVF